MGRVSRREGASAVSGSGTALTTTLHWRLSTLATHTSTSSSHGGGVGGTNVGSGRSMTPP